jgi:hypothetical protein
LRNQTPLELTVGQPLLAVLAELDFLVAVAHPDVAVLDEGGPLAVRRAAGAILGTRALGGPDQLLRLIGDPGGRQEVGFLGFRGRLDLRGRFAHGLGLDALVRSQVALPGLPVGAEAEGLAAVEELDAVERQPIGLAVAATRLRQGGSQLLVVERRLALAGLGIDDDEFFGPAAQIVAIPEAAVVREPVRRDVGLVDAAEGPGPLGALEGGLELLRGRNVLLWLGARRRPDEAGARHGQREPCQCGLHAVLPMGDGLTVSWCPYSSLPAGACRNAHNGISTS